MQPPVLQHILLPASRQEHSQMCVIRVQGFSFLHRYLDLRGPCQESFYNLGRGLHQLGLLHLAIHYYQKVLDLPPLALEVLHLVSSVPRIKAAQC